MVIFVLNDRCLYVFPIGNDIKFTDSYLFDSHHGMKRSERDTGRLLLEEIRKVKWRWKEKSLDRE
jgi:hypothetical protein